MIPTSIVPWLAITDGTSAVQFYAAAFGAVETYHLEAPDGSLILRLSVDGAEFWVSGGPEGSTGSPANPVASETEAGNPTHETGQPLGGDSVRMILTVPDPETLFAKALRAGATQIFPVGIGHGWKLGRLVDPFGLHWEIGHPL